MATGRYLGHPVIPVLTTRVAGCASIAAGEVLEVSDEAAAQLDAKYPGMFAIELNAQCAAAAAPAVDRAVKAPPKKQPKAKAPAKAKPKPKRAPRKTKAKP